MGGTEGGGVMADRQFLETLARKLADEGKLIEAGWVSLRAMAIPLNAPAVQLENMHMAYMAGAQHLFASMIGMLDPDADVTDDDNRRMDLIHKELEDYRQKLELMVARAKGSA
jgi:hypothetical protein